MKVSKNDVRSSARSIPRLRFEDQALTSCAGAVLYQALFATLGIRDSLRACVRGVKGVTPSGSYGLHNILNLLLVHLMLGWRRLSDLRYYCDDPIVQRLVGLKRLPSISTVSRALKDMTPKVVDRLRDLLLTLVLQRVQSCKLSRLTVDFDGSVLSTKSRRTEGTAVGFNKKAKGERSYYPLFATVAQTGQVLDVLHRPGNVHDSNGAGEFIEATLKQVRRSGFRGTLEVRLDSAHFSDRTCLLLDRLGTDFSVSVPFERFPKLKEQVQSRRAWRKIDKQWSYFEVEWNPKSWNTNFRVIVYRRRRKIPRKGPVQLDLFEPFSWEYEYKAVMTNKTGTAKSVLPYHNGRGSQEGVFAELKSQSQMDYLPTRRLVGNQVFTLLAALGHNLNRELQMRTTAPERTTTMTRACLWVFEKIGTFRHRLIQRAGRLTRPNGTPTLTMSANAQAASDIQRILARLQAA